MNPSRLAGAKLRRIVIIRPCCIGDVVMATAALTAARRAFPDAHLTFAVGSWSRQALTGHPHIDDFLDTGSADLPTHTLAGFLRFVGQLRAGLYDLAISLVRSAKMSLAIRLSGIPFRAGIDSGGRGFGYQFRAQIEPTVTRHESEIYLDVLRALGIVTAGYLPNIPLQSAASATLRSKLEQREITIGTPYFVLHPGGGTNPGMQLPSKRWPIGNFADLAARLAVRWNAQPRWLVGQDEGSLLTALPEALRSESNCYIGALNFAEIAQLAAGALVYIGNDSGLSHLAAASGARVATIFGPTGPRRYSPRGPAAISLFRQDSLPPCSAPLASAPGWNWERDGITIEAAERAIVALVARES